MHLIALNTFNYEKKSISINFNRDGSLPESVMNNSTDYYQFTTGIGNELKKVTNFDEKLKQKYYEFYSSNPGEQRATCGVK